MITLIWAQDRAGGLGLRGQLPWYDKEELAVFKTLTNGRTLVVGSATAQGIPRLPNREVLVLSRSSMLHLPDYQKQVPSVEAVLTLSRRLHIFIAGGAKVYEAFAEYADDAYVSIMHQTYETDRTISPRVAGYFNPPAKIGGIYHEGNNFRTFYLTAHKLGRNATVVRSPSGLGTAQ